MLFQYLGRDLGLGCRCTLSGVRITPLRHILTRSILIYVRPVDSISRDVILL